jgi:hypothetical protein
MYHKHSLLKKLDILESHPTKSGLFHPSTGVGGMGCRSAVIVIDCMVIRLLIELFFFQNWVSD